MRANVFQVFPFNIDKVKLLTMRGAPGERGPKGDPGNFQLDQLAPTNSAAGSIANFADGGNDLPVKDLKVNIQPSQDLHGYSNPWSEGGGKNKFPIPTSAQTKNGVTVEATADGEIWVHGTPTIASGYINFLFATMTDTVVGQTVTVSINEKIVGVGVVFGSGNGSLNLTLTDTTTNKTGQYTTGNLECSINVRYDVGTINKKFKVQLELGSTPTAWNPYSNICPITGWTEAKVTRTGKNLNSYVNGRSSNGITFTVNSDGSVTAVGTATANAYNDASLSLEVLQKGYPYLKAGTYIISGINNNVRGYYVLADDTGTAIGNATAIINDTAVTLSKDAYLYLRLQVPSGTTVNETVYPMIRLASDASTTFSPYQGITITIPLGSTVYGGTLDVVTGQLVVDYVKYTPTGTGAQESGNLFAKGSGNVNVYYTLLQASSPLVSSQTIANVQNFPFFRCSHYPIGNSATTDSAYVSNKQLRVCLRLDDERNTADKFNAWVAQQYQNGTPLEFVAKLATPLTYTLSETQINTLLGVNNIWNDAGDTSVDYYADTKLYINLAGQTEDDMTANANIASGRYFQIGNTLYISTAAIAAGETIVPGTNCRKTTIAEALNALL